MLHEVLLRWVLTGHMFPRPSFYEILSIVLVLVQLYWVCRRFQAGDMANRLRKSTAEVVGLVVFLVSYTIVYAVYWRYWTAGTWYCWLVDLSVYHRSPTLRIKPIIVLSYSLVGTCCRILIVSAAVRATGDVEGMGKFQVRNEREDRAVLSDPSHLRSTARTYGTCEGAGTITTLTYYTCTCDESWYEPVPPGWW